MTYGEWTVMTSRDPERCCEGEAVRLAILATAWLLVYSTDSAK